MTTKRTEETAAQKPDIRTQKMWHFMTPEDEVQYKTFAKKMGFKSAGELTTAIIERLMVGGFSPLVFFKLGLQLNAHAKAQGAAFDGGFYFGVRPLPALPDQHISAKQWKKELVTVRAELAKEEETA